MEYAEDTARLVRPTGQEILALRDAHQEMISVFRLMGIQLPRSPAEAIRFETQAVRDVVAMRRLLRNMHATLSSYH